MFHYSLFFGGAGFYLNATKEPWSRNYKMYDYITKELPELILNKFEFSKSKIGIFGHSMGPLIALSTFGLNGDC